MGQARKVVKHAIPLMALFALATYTAPNIQTHIGDSTTFNKTLGLSSPLIVDSDSLYVNPTAIITNAALTTIACSVLASGKPRSGLTKYPLGIITVYAILSVVLFLVITTEPAYTCTPLPTNLDSMTVFMASIVIGPATPLVYAREKRWRVNGDWKPLLFTLYVSIVVGSLIIDVATALAISPIPQPAPDACIGLVTIRAYGPIDGLVTAPPLGLLAGYIVMSTSTIMNKQ
jgi:hypothetical protein